MTTMRRLLALPLFLLMLMALAGSAAAQATSAGTSAAPFLRLSPLARPMGMAEAFTAVSGDLASIHYNPAGLTGLSAPEVAFTHASFIQGTDFQHIAAGFRAQPGLAFAPFLTRFGVTDVARGPTGIESGRFDNTDWTAGLSVGYLLRRDLALGANVKYVQSELAQYHASAVAVDLGLRYDFEPVPGLAFGVSAANIGPDLTFISDGSPLPLTGRAGLAYRTGADRSLLAADVSIDREENVLFHLGGELRIAAPIVLRGGLKIGGDRSFQEAAKLGLGFDGRFGRLDYAFESFEDLGVAHRFSYAYLFGQPLLDRPEPTASSRDFFQGLFAGASARSVSIQPFQSVEEGSPLSWLERGMPEIVAARLRAGGIAVIPSGGRYEISGRFARMDGGRLWVSARLVDPKEGRLIAFRDAVVAQDQIFAAGETLGAQLLAEIPR